MIIKLVGVQFPELLATGEMAHYRTSHHSKARAIIFRKPARHQICRLFTIISDRLSRAHQGVAGWVANAGYDCPKLDTNAAFECLYFNSRSRSIERSRIVTLPPARTQRCRIRNHGAPR